MQNDFWDHPWEHGSCISYSFNLPVQEINCSVTCVLMIEQKES